MYCTSIINTSKRIIQKLSFIILILILIGCSQQQKNDSDLTYSINNYCKALGAEFETSQYMLENMLEKDSIPSTSWQVFKHKGTHSLLTLYWGRFVIETRDDSSNHTIDTLKIRYDKLHEEMRTMNLWYTNNTPNRDQITELRDKLIELNMLIKEINKIGIRKN